MTSSEPRRAVVLGSGGVLGFAWLLGALGAVEDEAGFDVRTAEVAIGTSAGSVAAALLGCGLSVDVMCRHHQGEPTPDDPAIEYDYHSGAGEALPPRLPLHQEPVEEGRASTADVQKAGGAGSEADTKRLRAIGCHRGKVLLGRVCKTDFLATEGTG